MINDQRESIIVESIFPLLVLPHLIQFYRIYTFVNPGVVEKYTIETGGSNLPDIGESAIPHITLLCRHTETKTTNISTHNRQNYTQ